MARIITYKVGLKGTNIEAIKRYNGSNTLYMISLAVILIWRFGKFLLACQI